jgi:hypothetical protein
MLMNINRKYRFFFAYFTEKPTLFRNLTLFQIRLNWKRKDQLEAG